MGVFDALKEAWKKSRDDAGVAAAENVTRESARAVGSAVTSAAEGILSDAEARLEEARAEQADRPDNRPRSGEADAIASRIQETVRAADASASSDEEALKSLATVRAETREARSRSELARLKAAMQSEE